MADNKLTNDERDALMHWGEFGQGGEASKTRVAPPTKERKPFLTPIASKWDQIMPNSQLSKLLNGFQPVEMEDKWLVYAEGPDAQGQAMVHMLRSWTGKPMAEVKLSIPITDEGEIGEGDARMTEIIWESSNERYRYQTEQGAKAMVKEVCRWCMGISLP